MSRFPSFDGKDFDDDFSRGQSRFPSFDGADYDDDFSYGQSLPRSKYATMGVKGVLKRRDTSGSIGEMRGAIPGYYANIGVKGVLKRRDTSGSIGEMRGAIPGYATMGLPPSLSVKNFLDDEFPPSLSVRMGVFDDKGTKGVLKYIGNNNESSDQAVWRDTEEDVYDYLWNTRHRANREAQQVSKMLAYLNKLDMIDQ